MNRYILSSITLLLPLFAQAQNCREIEYAEIKDMSTIELREVGSKYYGITGEKQFKLKGEELLASTGSMHANASTIGKINAEIETCKQQMEKISSQLKKRKDIKASKKKSLINMFEGEFFKSYNIPE